MRARAPAGGEVLREVPTVRQDNPALARRWFHSDYFDLFTWQDSSETIVKFQLCYDVERRERAFVWSADHGARHDGVEYADRGAARPAAAIFVQDGKLDSGTVVPRFELESANIPAKVRDFVLAGIREHLIGRHRLQADLRRARRAPSQRRDPGN